MCELVAQRRLGVSFASIIVDAGAGFVVFSEE